VAAFGVDALARGEAEAMPGHQHVLGVPRDQVHLDPLQSGIPARFVTKGRRSKSAPASRFSRASRLRLKAAVTPAASS
jgi:hypothetical protein